MSIKTIIKRNGNKETFNPTKINKWSQWAADGVIEWVDWSAVVMETVKGLGEEISSRDLQLKLIDTCITKSTRDKGGDAYNIMAGHLYSSVLHKDIHGDNLPTVKQMHEKLLDLGLMVNLDYSEEDYNVIEKFIDHNKDFHLKNSQLEYIMSKYAIQSRVTGDKYETPQFTFMRMAMALAEPEKGENRIESVRQWYEEFSEGRLNAPTPNYTNLGTPLRSYFSCCLYASGDSADSLSTGDHIAYKMTCESAGIGNTTITRSVGDPVRNGAIEHQGKRPYLASLGKAVKANLQNGRGGSATTFVNAFDPEIRTIQTMKNPKTPEDIKNRDIDYATVFNRFLVRKAARNEEIFLFNTFTAPDLFEACYSGDEQLFESLYTKYENDVTFRKQWISARDLVVQFIVQSHQTGRFYFANADEINKHTPFKEPIYQSNLCVAPETKILTDKGYEVISEIAGQKANVWNGEEFSEVDVVKTGEGQKLLAVTTSGGFTLECTEYHKWYLKDGTEVRTVDLKNNDELLTWKGPKVDTIYSDTIVSVKDEGRIDDTYCFTESKRHMGVFNGILTGQCVEIVQPTKPYIRIIHLYDEDTTYTDEDGNEQDKGEISLCALAAINVAKFPIDGDYDSYYKTAYLALKMINRCIDISEYAFPHLKTTAKLRRNAGNGIIGLAECFAQNGIKYSSQEGKDAAHKIAERHMYANIEASLKLSQEFGVAGWIDRTKWPEGWLPIDTYNRKVDELVTVECQYDWEDLRKRVVENGGIRNSVLVAHMPSESSSKATGTTNGLYPIRDISVMKTDATGKPIRFVAPNSHLYYDSYETAWKVPASGLIDIYAIIQKFSDQSISADEYNVAEEDEELDIDSELNRFFRMIKYGMKTRYYMNTKTTKGGFFTETIQEAGCAGGSCTL